MNPISPIPVITAVFSQLSEEASSQTFTFSRNWIKSLIKEKQFHEILDQYDRQFLKYYDNEISVHNVDMGALSSRRKDLLILSKKVLSQKVIRLNINHRKRFINEACQIIGDYSDIVGLYLNGFFDLVSMKETKDISLEGQATINTLVDQICDEFQKHEHRIVTLETKIDNIRHESIQDLSFSDYYDYVNKQFTKKKSGDYEKLVGSYSDEEAYIAASIRYGYVNEYVLPFLEKWYKRDKYGIMLIYGEPGHGKTMLCHKAMVDFSKGSFLKDRAKNVLTVSLNTGDNRRIIADGMVNIENALAWGYNRQHRFSLDDCRDSLLFMDGFDEFIDEAKGTNVNDIVTFMKILEGIADEYDIHIIVLSRTIAVKGFLSEPTMKYISYQLMPLTDIEQDSWLESHIEYEDYLPTFKTLRNNGDMRTLLGIPFLFRLIIHSRFNKITSNVVELYSTLTNHLMEKRNIRGAVLGSVIAGLNNLAYKIYCTDTDTTIIKEDERNSHWILAFYIKQSKEGKIGFFHRSFYQYFLARNIYDGIFHVTNDGIENYIGLFAERELDDTVRQYLSLMLLEEDKETIYNNLRLAIDTLITTEAYTNLKPFCSIGDAEKTRLGRTRNIYRNLLHLCAAFSYVIQVPIKLGLNDFLKTYNSDYIQIVSNNQKIADLSEANLSGAHLDGAILKNTNLSGANLRYASLKNANLEGANLAGANLNGANLAGAKLINTNLKGANLINANLETSIIIQADLTEANLERANLKKANLEGSKMDRTNLEGASLFDANMLMTSLERANLSQTILDKANLQKSNLRESVLNNASMKGSTLCSANLRGSRLLGATLRGADLVDTDLSKANMQDAILRDVNLQGAYLCDTNMVNTNLREAKIREAYLDGADISDSDLCNADLSSSNLGNVKLFRAILTGTIFRKTIMNKVDFRQAYLRGAILNGANIQCSNMSSTNLQGSNLLGANLREVDLSRSNLKGAFLGNAKLEDINLSDSNLHLANLNGAYLIGVDLSRANLNEAILLDTKLEIKHVKNMIIGLENYKIIDPSIEYFNTIKWVT